MALSSVTPRRFRPAHENARYANGEMARPPHDSPVDLQRDREQAIVEFSEAEARDPAFVEPRIGVLSCLGNLAYRRRGDAAAMKDVIGRMMPLTKEILAAAPESPRLY
jgi:hypothetical protein